MGGYVKIIRRAAGFGGWSLRCSPAILVAFGTGLVAAAEPVSAPFAMFASDIKQLSQGDSGKTSSFQMRAEDTEHAIKYSGIEGAGDAELVANPDASILFSEQSSADISSVTINYGGVTTFADDSTAEASTIANNGNLNIADRATAGEAAIVNNAAGTIDFSDAATAGRANIENSGALSFSDTSTKGLANVTNNATGIVDFNDLSTAGSKGITNNGSITFRDQSSAQTGFIANNAGGSVVFDNNSTAAQSTVANSGSLTFAGEASAGSAALINNSTGKIRFADTSSAASSVINSSGLLGFTGASTAGDAVILTQTGGVTNFADGASGANAQFRLDDDAVLDFSQLRTDGTSVGSLLGTGTVALGSKTLTVGSNNLSTAVSGIVDGGIGGGAGGSLVKVGAGTLRLDGENSYTGSTFIASGTLQAAAANAFAPRTATVVQSGAILDIAGSDQEIGSLAGAGQVDLAANTLTLGGDNTSTVFSGKFLAAGGIVKRGAGTLTLTGDSTYFGSTDVVAGGLQVDGNIALSAVTVRSGAFLGGSGTIGAGVIEAGATLTPGAAGQVGVLKVSGDLELAQNAVYLVDISGNQSDSVEVTGALALDGSTLKVGQMTNFDPNTSYSILTASNGITGTFSEQFSNYAFLVGTLDYGTGSVSLRLARNEVAFPDVTLTSNQFAVAGAIESRGAVKSLYDEIVLADAASARDGFDQLSGEIHASLKSGLIADGGAVREIVLDRLSQAVQNNPSQPVEAWSKLLSGRGSASEGEYFTRDQNRSAFLVGLDGVVDDRWRFGFLAGTDRSSIALYGLSSSAVSDGAMVGVYGGTSFGALNVSGGASYQLSDVAVARTFSFGGVSDSLSSDYNAQMTQVFGEVGYALDLAALRVEPFAGLALVGLQTSGFAEDGGDAALSGSRSSMQSNVMTFGVRASSTFDISGVPVTAHAMGGWQHRSGDLTPQTTLAFKSGDQFVVGGTPLAKDAAIVEIGLEMALNSRLSLRLSYGGEFSENAAYHSARIAISGKF